MSDLTSLRERVGKATGADRELAFALFETLEADDRYREMIAGARARIASGELSERDLLNWRVFDESYSARALQSVDAALGLVEAKIPFSTDAGVSKIESTWYDGPVWRCEILRANVVYVGSHRDLPLAILDALLAALSEQRP